MKKIYKYQLETQGEQKIKMPIGAEILCVQTQLATPCLWALVDPNAKEEEITIDTFGTGHPINGARRTYLGTYQLMGGSIIFHVFKRE